MKRVLSLISVFLCVVITVSHAQDATPEWKHLRVGPMFTAGASVNAGDIAQGWKTSPKFSYSIGALLDLPLTPNISADLTVGYNARSINFHDQANPDKRKYDYTFGYAVLQPEFRFSSFILGFGVGMPISGNEDYIPAVDAQPVSRSISAGSLGTLFEIRLGADIPIMESETGKLAVLIHGAYALTKNYTTNSPFGSLTENNGPLATLQAGVCYLFDFTKRPVQ
jgi:hypothetical protein